jgi:hypothetical protein
LIRQNTKYFFKPTSCPQYFLHTFLVAGWLIRIPGFGFNIVAACHGGWKGGFSLFALCHLLIIKRWDMD